MCSNGKVTAPQVQMLASFRAQQTQRLVRFYFIWLSWACFVATARLLLISAPLQDLFSIPPYLACAWLPAVGTIRGKALGRSIELTAIQLAIVGNVLHSVQYMLAGVGYLPCNHCLINVVRTIELPLEMLVAVTLQLDPWTMAILHLLRVLGLASIMLYRVHLDATHVMLRTLFNWLVLVAVSVICEARSRVMFKRQCSLTNQQRRHSQQQGALCCQQLAGDLAAWDTSKPAAPFHPVEANVSVACSSSTPCEVGDIGMPPQGTTSSVINSAGKHSSSSIHAAALATLSLATSLPLTASAPLAPLPDPTTLSDPDLPPPEPCPPDWVITTRQPAPTASKQATEHSTSREDTVAPAVLSMLTTAHWRARESQTASRASLWENLKQQSQMPYRRKARQVPIKAQVKLQDLRVSELPAELPGLLRKQLQRCMPGVSLDGVSLREGCVMLTLDLWGAVQGRAEAVGHEGEAAWYLASELVAALSHALNESGTGVLLPDGSGMTVQVDGQLLHHAWDRAASTYSGGSRAAVDPQHRAAWEELRREAAQCHILGTVPAVHCVAADCHQPLVLPLQLQLPSHSRLLGWQPADSAAAPEDGVLVAGTETSSAVPLDVRVLVRHQGGAYLPVSVKPSSQAVRPGATHNTSVVEAEVSATVGVSTLPQGCFLEVVCSRSLPVAGDSGRSSAADKPHMDLCVTDLPLLPLPDAWCEAAVELSQHVALMGGVLPNRHLPNSERPVSAASTLQLPVVGGASQGFSCMAASVATPNTPNSDTTDSLASPWPQSDPCNTQPPVGASTLDTPAQASTHSQPPCTGEHQAMASLYMADMDLPDVDDEASQVPPGDTSVASEVGSMLDSSSMTQFLEDLGRLVSKPRRCVGGSDGRGVVLGDALVELGMDVLLYAVGNGLLETARLVVAALEGTAHASGAGGDVAGMAGLLPDGRLPRPWFLRCTETRGGAGAVSSSGVASGATDDCEEGGLLHAACMSGEAAVLEAVLRWGQLYGGRQWRWPWSLTDEVGCTALHLAAYHPEPGVCAALLNTLARMLPSSEVEAARHVWHTAPDRSGVTPVQSFSALHPTIVLGDVWMHVAAPAPASTAASVSDSTTAASSSQDRGVAAGTPATPGAPEETNRWSTEASSAADNEWLSVVCEAWTLTPSQDYLKWLEKQMSSIICSWASTLFVVGLVCMCRSAASGCLTHEFTNMTIHSICYLPCALSAAGLKRVGHWRGWTIVCHLFHSLAYLVVSFTAMEHLKTWITAAQNGVDVVYMMLIVAPIDQTLLPLLVVLRAWEAFTHSLAYRAANLPHALPRALALHATCVFVTMSSRMWQVRVHRRWRARQDRQAQEALDREVAEHIKKQQ